jgi:hypothetical protein
MTPTPTPPPGSSTSGSGIPSTSDRLRKKVKDANHQSEINRLSKSGKKK